MPRRSQPSLQRNSELGWVAEVRKPRRVEDFRGESKRLLAEFANLPGALDQVARFRATQLATFGGIAIQQFLDDSIRDRCPRLLRVKMEDLRVRLRVRRLDVNAVSHAPEERRIRNLGYS